MLTQFYDLQRLLGATFSMEEEEEEAKYHPLTRFALMALARKKRGIEGGGEAESGSNRLQRELSPQESRSSADEGWESQASSGVWGPKLRSSQHTWKVPDDAVSRLFIPIYLCVRDFRSQNSARARKERAFVLSSLECIDSSVCDRVLWVRQNVSLSGTGKLNCGQGMLPKIRIEKNVI